MIKYDLILTVVNRGYADEVMKAAKKAGAFGGTVLNARGTGTNELQEFFGALIQPEKDLIMILTEREKRNDIMMKNRWEMTPCASAFWEPEPQPPRRCRSANATSAGSCAKGGCSAAAPHC